MLKEVLHIGITVSNMEKSLHFYRDILGLNFVGELVMSGEETDKLFAKECTSARVCYLNGSSSLQSPPIELIEFSEIVEQKKQNLFKTGISEVCFKVENIDAEYERLKKLGVNFLSKPQYFDFAKFGFSKSKAVYFYDTDGIILELIEVIK